MSNERKDWIYVGDGVYYRKGPGPGFWLFTHNGYQTTNEIWIDGETLHNLKIILKAGGFVD